MDPEPTANYEVMIQTDRNRISLTLFGLSARDAADLQASLTQYQTNALAHQGAWTANLTFNRGCVGITGIIDWTMWRTS